MTALLAFRGVTYRYPASPGPAPNMTRPMVM